MSRDFLQAESSIRHKVLSYQLRIELKIARTEIIYDNIFFLLSSMLHRARSLWVGRQSVAFTGSALTLRWDLESKIISPSYRTCTYIYISMLGDTLNSFLENSTLTERTLERLVLWRENYVRNLHGAAQCISFNIVWAFSRHVHWVSTLRMLCALDHCEIRSLRSPLALRAAHWDWLESKSIMHAPNIQELFSDMSIRSSLARATMTSLCTRNKRNIKIETRKKYKLICSTKKQT